ncbi:MAG: efflux RND transporter periplasmic adaptor subunit [Bacteroidia bacterium]
MKSLKTFTASALALLFLASCGSKSIDKKTELDNLIKQQSELTDKINKLKNELEAKGDSTLGNPNIKSVALATIAVAPFNHYVDVQAKVDADESINANPKMGGTITEVLVKEGDRVSAGQVLAKMDDQLMKQSISELQTQIDFATNIYNKQKSLWDQQIGSEVQYLTSKNNKESLEHKMATLREQWSMTQIKSPISGTVDNIFIKIGQSVMPGLPCINVVNLTGLKIKAEVAESFISKINAGDNVIISMPDLSLEFPSKVSFASSVVNATSRTFTVEVRLPKADPRLKPNMIAVMKINDYSSANAIAIPINVVQSSSDGNYVLTIVTDGGKNIVTKKTVETGLSYNGIVEIKKGLEAGEKIISTGYEDVNPGEEVKN